MWKANLKKANNFKHLKYKYAIFRHQPPCTIIGRPQTSLCDQMMAGFPFTKHYDLQPNTFISYIGTFEGPWWFHMEFKWQSSVPYILRHIAGTPWVGGLKEWGGSGTGWQRDRVAACPSEGSVLADCPGQLESTHCTHPGIRFQEPRDKQDQIKFSFYLFLQPAVMFHSLNVFLFIFLSRKAFAMAMCCVDCLPLDPVPLVCAWQTIKSVSWQFEMGVCAWKNTIVLLLSAVSKK